MRTPHGEAEVSIETYAATTTLGEVVAAVTGQALPRLVHVDGRVVDGASRLDDAGLCIGSVVTTEPTVPRVPSAQDIDLVQVAGHGTGRIRALGPGHYRIGPGRRSSADELDLAPVERTAFELVVEVTDQGRSATVVRAGSDVEVDGVSVSADQAWHDGLVTVDSRAFQLRDPADTASPPPQSPPDRDGTIAFSRPPRRGSTRHRQPVVDAIRDARSRATTLWECRPDQPGFLTTPIGIRVADGSNLNLDLGTEAALAITGSDHFRRALARSVIVEVVTAHGPADVDLVVVADTGRLAAWDWAKWLPHARPDGPPRIWSSLHDITQWAEGDGATPGGRSRITIAIIDSPDLWNRRDAPLRAIVSSPPAWLRLIALCDGPTQAPAVCSTMVSETADGFARLEWFARPGDDVVFRAALIETSIAGDVARALAPLADIEMAAQSTIDGHPVELAELIGVVDTDDIVARWAAIDPRTAATIGRLHDQNVEVPVAVDVTIAIGTSMGDAFDLAASLLFSQCVERSPDDLWLVPLAFDDSARSELLRQLPHATAPHDANRAIESHRLLTRVRTVLADPAGPDRVVLVAEAPIGSVMAAATNWLNELADGVRTIEGVALVVITDRPDGANVAGDTVIRVQRRVGATDTTVRRSATLDDSNGTPGQPFIPLQRTPRGGGALEVSPYVVGRAFTALERRTEQRRSLAASVPDVAFESLAKLLRDAAARHRSGDARTDRTVVPPPMPTRVDLEELFTTLPGDGIPLGLADDPAAAGVRTHWWEPTSGSLLVLGSRRSGMEQVLTTALLGLIDRFSDLDVRVIVVEQSAERRRALVDLHRGVRPVSPERADEVADALDDITAELDRRKLPIDPGAERAPQLVVLIGDLAHLRRRYADHAVGSRLDEVLTAAAAPGSGVDLIASVSELDAAGPIASVASNRLVGASSNHDELSALGVENPGELEGIVGRCRSFPGGDLVQLAMTDTSVETLLALRAIEEHQ